MFRLSNFMGVVAGILSATEDEVTVRLRFPLRAPRRHVTRTYVVTVTERRLIYDEATVDALAEWVPKTAPVSDDFFGIKRDAKPLRIIDGPYKPKRRRSFISWLHRLLAKLFAGE